MRVRLPQTALATIEFADKHHPIAEHMAALREARGPKQFTGCFRELQPFGYANYQRYLN